MALVEAVLLADLADGCSIFFFNAFDIFKYTLAVASVVRFADCSTFFHDILLASGADSASTGFSPEGVDQSATTCRAGGMR